MELEAEPESNSDNLELFFQFVTVFVL